MKNNTQLLRMTTQTDDNSVWKKHLRKQNNDKELIWKTPMALTEMSPRTEYLQTHRANSEHHSQHSPPGFRVRLKPGGALLSIDGLLLKKQPVSIWNVDFFLSTSLKHSFCVLHHCHCFNWFVLHCYHAISLTLWANKVIIGDVVRTRAVLMDARISLIIYQTWYLESRQLCISNFSCIF